MMIWVTRDSSYGYITAYMLIFATGLGLTAAPATTAIMLQTPEKKYGVASAVNDAGREIGAALGIALSLSLIHISEPTRLYPKSRMPSSA